MTALEIAGIKPEDIAKWKAGGFGRSPVVRTEEKNGAAAAAEENILSRWINITPEMAERWLKSNFGNRPVSDDVVSAYARDMVNGLWQPTHQGIAFNDSDKLIDGQHRLLAIVKCGKTIRMMVTFGLRAKIEGHEMTTMDCVDRGRTRSVADQLKIQHGLKNGSAIAQVCSALAHLCVGERMRRLSVGQTLDIYREFKAGVDFVIEWRSKATGLKSAGVLGAFAFCHSVASIKEMFTRLMTGDEQTEYPALIKLREFLTGENASLILASMNRGIAELSVWAIWCEVENITIEKLATEPADWIKAVEYFRNLQRDRVDKIATIFKLPKVEPVAGEKPAKALAPAQPSAPSETPAIPARERPKLDLILSKVEITTKLSRFILTGRGSGGEIDQARSLFVTIARSYGYTEEVVALALRKNPDQCAAWNLPPAAMSAKQKKAMDTIKSKL